MSDTVESIMAEWEKKRTEQMSMATKQIAETSFPPQVAKIVVEYNGSGDEGSIDSIRYEDAEGNEVGLPNCPTSQDHPIQSNWKFCPACGQQVARTLKRVDVVIENFVYAALPGGWEINDGSSGTMTIDLQTKKASLNHRWNVMETTEENREFGL